MKSLKKLMMIVMTLAFGIAFSTIKIDAKAAPASYNSAAALQYAEENWNSGEGLCAEYCSNALKRGGVSAWSKSCTELRRQLLATGMGTEHSIKLESDNSIDMNKYGDLIKPGDIIFYYCKGCNDGRPYIHAVMCAGENNGRMTAFSHNSANSGINAYKYSSRCYSCYTPVDDAVLFSFSDRLPTGSISEIKGCEGGIYLQGEAWDPDTTSNIKLHLYVDGPVGSGARAYVLETSGSEHLFNTTIPVKESGKRTVYLYALNEKSPDYHNPLIGTGTVYIPEAKNDFTIDFAGGDSITYETKGNKTLSFSFTGDGIYTMKVNCDTSIIKPLEWEKVDWKKGEASLKVDVLEDNCTLEIVLLNRNYEELYKKSVKLNVASSKTENAKFDVSFDSDMLCLGLGEVTTMPIEYKGLAIGEEIVTWVLYDQDGKEIFRKNVTIKVDNPIQAIQGVATQVTEQERVENQADEKSYYDKVKDWWNFLQD